MGTPQELSNEKGEVVWLSYDRAWGKSYRTVYEPQAVGHCAVSADDIQPFKFQGQMFDGESNLHYNRFRYYDYDAGMFIQRDPIGLLGGNNVFAYAPNPVSWIDPLGLVTSSDAYWSLRNRGVPQTTTVTGKTLWGTDITTTGYSQRTLNQEWFKLESIAIKNFIKSGKMLPCPKKLCSNSYCIANDTKNWEKYGGDPNAFHCGFTGFLETRVSKGNYDAPTNECFYDHKGDLVDENHKYKGCRGTPDYFPFYGYTPASLARSRDHWFNDAGGPHGPSLDYENLQEEAEVETQRFFKENPNYKPKK